MNRFLPFEWIAATRFLKEGAVQTLLIITGVAVGVGVVVFMSALLSGLQGDFLKRMFSSQAQIVLQPPDKIARPLRTDGDAIVLATVIKPSQRLRSIDQWQKVRDITRTIPGILTVSPMASGAAFAVKGGADKSISLMGVDPAVYFSIVDIPGKLTAGMARLNVGDILIGIQLASDLGVAVNDKLRITTASGASQTLTITGIFDLGNRGANQRNTYVALHTAQTLLGLTGGVTSIDVTVKDVYAAEDIAQLITAATGVEADSWIKTNADFFSFINSQNMSNAAIRIFVSLSVAFGIASVLVVSVVQRSKEIGILRAMGASRGQMLRVFLIQGGLVGFLGSLLGSSLGWAILAVWRDYARHADGTPLFTIVMEPSLVLLAMLLATVTGVAAAILPAMRAARLEPVVAIRG
ncbi:MAG TPA: FtsX-like permease family protein [Dongiaceae bacterium]|nr:FtsX-like permease family protein [Dongiaceae bacterium]